jgi:hypothetical protein
VTGAASTELGRSVEIAQNPFVGSERSLAQASSWLEYCYSSHPKCDHTQSDFVPRRLLRIEQSEIMHLVEDTSKQRLRWAALSYVWGGPQIFSTTNACIDEIKRGFLVKELPQTLRDAVTVCQALALEYMWIDSLCIIQDDVDDLDRELGTMPRVYQEAWVTISASTAASVNEGFLHDRRFRTSSKESYQKNGGVLSSDESSIVISLPYITDSSVAAGEVIMGESKDAMKDGITCGIHDAIDSRAWTFQERRLSPRLLNFTDNKLVFSCNTARMCEGEGSASGIVDRPHNLHPVADQDLPKWHGVVAEYVTRKLSFPGDKLRAISALADVYRLRTDHIYIAGLCKDTLIGDLCWKNNGSRLLPRPTEYRAPSWSWAAIDHNHTLWWKPRELYPSQIQYAEAAAVVFDVTLPQKPAGTTYGRIYGGSITIEAPTLLVTWERTKTFTEIGDGYWTKDVFADAEEEAPSTPVLALLLTRPTYPAKHKDLTVSFGLLLNKHSSHAYQRVGFFELAWRLGDFDTEYAQVGFKKQITTIV